MNKPTLSKMTIKRKPKKIITIIKKKSLKQEKQNKTKIILKINQKKLQI